MKIVRKNQTQRFNHGLTCTAIEYPLADADINVAVVELNGRYPQKGWAMNELSKELAFVAEGFGEVDVDGEKAAVGAGDLVLINPGEKYFWSGKLKIVMPCAPAWTQEQYKLIGGD